MGLKKNLEYFHELKKKECNEEMLVTMSKTCVFMVAVDVDKSRVRRPNKIGREPSQTPPRFQSSGGFPASSELCSVEGHR